jgi:hypothetical protein
MTLVADSGTTKDSIGFGNLVCDMRRSDGVKQGLLGREFNQSR